MRLSRLSTGAGPRCAVAAHQGWALLDRLKVGLAADDPAAALGELPMVRQALAALEPAELEATGGWISQQEARLLCPVPAPSKLICIGLNYREHIAETGGEVPSVPTVFAKFPNALSGPFADIPLHSDQTDRLDYEGELVVVVGRWCRDLTPNDALAAVGGYAVANDVSARDRQFSEGGQWVHSKTYDGFCPIGPWITTAEEVPDPAALELRTWVNGEQRQHTSTGDMVFGIPELLCFLSAGITLAPGDLILTGTPAGVALGRPDRPWLRAGDVVRVEIGGLGAIENQVSAAVRPPPPAAPARSEVGGFG